MEAQYDPMDHEITVSKYDLISRFDDIPVGSHYHIEGAHPVFTEFPGADFKPKQVTFKKKMSQNMSSFKGRIKLWWAGLTSKRRMIKPAMKSTTGAKFHKPTFKNLKHRTHFNKSLKFDHWNRSEVKVTPMQHSYFMKDIPAITISKAQLKNWDEVPVGAHVHFEGAPVFTAFPTGEFKRKALPVGKQIKRDMNVFMLRVKKWWSGLEARKTIKSTSLKMKKQIRAPLMAGRTKFDKTKRFNHWYHSQCKVAPIREKIFVKDLPPAILVNKAQMRTWDDVPVGAHVHFEGAFHYTPYPTYEQPRKHAPLNKQFSHDMSRIMTKAKSWWKNLQTRRIIKETGMTLKKQMWGKSALKRTKFNKMKRYNPWSSSLVLDKSNKSGQIYMKELPRSGMIISKNAKNWDEVPVGIHLEGSPVFTEFPAAGFKPKSRPITKKIQKDINSFLSRSKKYWNGLKSRRIMKKGELAMKKGMKKTFKLSNRTKFDKTKKFDHWNKMEVLVKPAHSDVVFKQQGMGIKKPIHEESKHDAFSRKMENKL